MHYKILSLEKYAEHKTKDGKRILSNEYIQHLRGLNLPQKHFIPQSGGQELALSSTADITVYGGKRGGGKTWVELFEPIKDINNPHFVGYVLRKEKDDFNLIIDTSYNLYKPFGRYLRSANDMRWDFDSGASLSFRYFKDSSFEEFKDRFQGREIPYIGIDEVTQMPYKYFKYLMTCNRNSHHIRNRMMLTCNPDPNSWVADFIDWWIDAEGYPIPEKSGKTRYCFMAGDTVKDIVWGDTKKEVYDQCRDIIDKYWSDEDYEFTTPEDMFVKSVTFIIGELSENKVLLRSDPSYKANLVAQDEEQRARDLDGNWRYKEVGTDLITRSDMENFYTNTFQDDGIKCVTTDPALGGDNCVSWYWEGWHLKDIMVSKADGKTLPIKIKGFLERKGVIEENFAYDVNGIGQMLVGHFPRAIAFNNGGTPTQGDRNTFDMIKSEYAYKLVQKLKDREISIEPALLDYRFDTRRFRGMTLRDILLKESKAIRKKENYSDKNWALITKKEMIALIKWSPDFFESILTRFAIEDKIKTNKPQVKGLWRL